MYLLEAKDNGGDWYGGPCPEIGMYILRNKIAIPESDPKKWSEWLGNAYRSGERQVGASLYQCHGRRIFVSTIFLGVDYNLFGDRPILFESMAFLSRSRGEELCDRYSTWAEAEEGHYAMLRQAKIELLGVRADKV